MRYSLACTKLLKCNAVTNNRGTFPEQLGGRLASGSKDKEYKEGGFSCCYAKKAEAKIVSCLKEGEGQDGGTGTYNPPGNQAQGRVD
ncbi:hypothetical protein RhiTH_010195 [Rhizoctonia solani]